MIYPVLFVESGSVGLCGSCFGLQKSTIDVHKESLSDRGTYILCPWNFGRHSTVDFIVIFSKIENSFLPLLIVYSFLFYLFFIVCHSVL